jgi:serine/threonine-protein kinase
MTPTPQRVRDLFLAAVRCPVAEREAYLAEACAGDDDLRREAQELLDAHVAAGSFLEPPPPDLDATRELPQVSERPGTVIGPYKLLEQIGEGGFGVVFLAAQTQPVRRKVALKVLKPGMDTRQVVARFEAERQALALMDHSNIARVFDGGATASGRPYFVMELVKGVPIAEFCDQNHLGIRERLELFVSVCQAVQHAHQKGIIHRDLKPSNVLVTVHDTTPVVKVIDFGVAKALGQELTDKTLFTGFAQMIGTPLYMSPEQAGQSGLDVDTRSDIYSLGVLLYELLTGTTPFDKERLHQAGYDELRRIIREEDPARPSARVSTLAQAATTVFANRQSDPRRLRRLFRGELDWIVMKALEKDRNRRYETASAFAADGQRYLNDEPVQAAPPSAWYRFRKFARRNQTGLTVAGLVLFFMASLGGGVGWAVRDRAARQARAANELELALDRAELFQSQGKRAEALAAIERADLLAGEAPPDPARDARLAALKERLDADARDQEFIARFEEILLRVQSGVNVVENRFTPEAALPEIRDALRRYGVEIGVMAPVQAAALVRGRPELVRRNLVAALDECLKWTPGKDVQTRPWLLAALEAADDDAWRVRARNALVGGDRTVLEQMAEEVDEQKQPPNFLIVVARALPAQRRSARLELLRRIQRVYPADLWANFWLAQELMANGQPAEAVRYYTAMLVLRPNNPGVYISRGNALYEAGEFDAAIADAQEGVALAPQYAQAHHHLGLALTDRGRLDEAIAAYHEAIRLKPDHAEAHYGLGNAIRQKADLPGAMAEYRQAIALKPDFARAHCNLGLGLRLQGEFTKALEELRRGDELGTRLPRWRYPSAKWVRECERLVELDGQLPGFLERKAIPASPGERIELADLCHIRRLSRAATRFYEEAFAAEPRMVVAYRVLAAQAAALAGCGVGQDTDTLDDKERARLRRQALDWLRADLEAWGRRLDQESDRAGSAATVSRTLQYWLADPELAGVRGPEALAKLPEAERQPWQQFWGDVSETLARAQRKTTPEKKLPAK